MPTYAGFLHTAAGAADNGKTVNLLARNTTTPVLATTTTDSNGFWQIVHGTEGLFDLEVIIDSNNKFRIKYDDSIQIELAEFGQFFLRGTDDAFAMEFQATPTASRISTFPDNTGTVPHLNLAQAWTADQTLNDDVDLAFGTGKDILVRNRSSALAANVEVTDIIIGTSVHPGVAANSLIMSNITASGDVIILTNRGGNSEAHILLDGSTGDTLLYARGLEMIRLVGGGGVEFSVAIDFDNQNMTNVDIDSGAIDGAIIGAASAAAATFTTLIGTNVDGIIGANTPAAIIGTTLKGNTSLEIATGATVTGIDDDDSQGSPSDTLLVTQQSIVAYVDAQVGSSGATFLDKTADETVNNSTTLQSDDDLTFSVSADKNYAVWGILAVNTSTVADIKFQLSLPTDAKGDLILYRTAENQASDIDEATEQGVAGTGADLFLTFKGVIIVESNAGTAVLQWAQETQEVSDTKVLEGSWLAFKLLN